MVEYFLVTEEEMDSLLDTEDCMFCYSWESKVYNVIKSRGKIRVDGVLKLGKIMEGGE